MEDGDAIMSKRRVVITGLGLVSPIGNDVNTSFQSAIEGKKWH